MKTMESASYTDRLLSSSATPSVFIPGNWMGMWHYDERAAWRGWGRKCQVWKEWVDAIFITLIQFPSLKVHIHPHGWSLFSQDPCLVQCTRWGCCRDELGEQRSILCLWHVTEVWRFWMRVNRFQIRAIWCPRELDSFLTSTTISKVITNCGFLFFWVPNLVPWVLLVEMLNSCS